MRSLPNDSENSRCLCFGNFTLSLGETDDAAPLEICAPRVFDRLTVVLAAVPTISVLKWHTRDPASSSFD